MGHGGGGGSPKGLVHNLLMQFFTSDGSKIEVFEAKISHCVHTACALHAHYVHIPLATICTFLAGGALLWPTVLHVRF